MKREMIIEGMSCNHCKMRVEKALGELAGVDSVIVDLASKTATLELTAELEDVMLTEAVEDAGYDVVEIK